MAIHLAKKKALRLVKHRMARDIRSTHWKVVPLVMALILAAAAWGYTRYLHNFRISEDEGEYLYAAWRISLGEAAYRDFTSEQMPAFIYTGGALQRLFGPTWVPLRAASITAVLATGLLTFALGLQLHSPLVALLASVALLANDRVYAVGRVWRSDPYMLLGATLGLALFFLAVTRPRARQRRRWLAASGLAYAVATLFKLFGLLPAGGCILYLLWNTRAQSHRRAALRDLAVFVGALALPLILTIGAFTAIQPDFLGQVLGHHLQQGSTLSLSATIGKGLRLFIEFARYQPLFLALAGAGLIYLLRRADPAARALVAQLPTALAFLFIKRGLETRYLVYLAPTLGLLWAISLIETAHRVTAHARPALAQGLAISLVLGLGVWSLTPHIARDIRIARRYARRRTPVVAFLQQHTSPDDVVVSDELWLNFLAQRPTTRSAAAISEGAARIGQITGQRLLQEITETQAQAVVLDFGATGRQLTAMADFDAFYRSVQRSFSLVRLFTDDEHAIEVYLREDILPWQGKIHFGSQVALTGADLGPARLAADDTLSFTLRWQALDAPRDRLQYSLRLTDEQGIRWAQVDGPIQALRLHEGPNGLPFDASEPVSEWAPGQVALTPGELRLPAGLPPGSYRLTLRVYRAADQIPLPAIEPDGDRLALDVPISTVIVQPARIPPTAMQLTIPQARRVHWPGLNLLGHTPIPPTLRPGDTLTVGLYWQATEAARPRYHIRLTLTDSEGRPQVEREALLGGARYPTDQWRPGEALLTQYRLRIPPELTRTYHLMLSVQAKDMPATSKVRLAKLDIAGWPRRFTLPENLSRRLDVRFGDIATLAGYRLERTEDSVLEITLAWRALRTAERRYTASVHLLAPDGSIIAQQDHVPGDGAMPTTGWLPGEVILDRYSLALPSDLTTATYRLRIGLYDPASLERLPVTGKSVQGTQDSLLLEVSAPVRSQR